MWGARAGGAPPPNADTHYIIRQLKIQSNKAIVNSLLLYLQFLTDVHLLLVHMRLSASAGEVHVRTNILFQHSEKLHTYVDMNYIFHVAYI